MNLEFVIEPLLRLATEHGRIEAVINLFKLALTDCPFEEDEVESAQTGEIECEAMSLHVDVVGCRDECIYLEALQEAVEKLKDFLFHMA